MRRIIAILSLCAMLFGVVQPAFAEYRTGSKWGDAGVYGTAGGILAVGLLTLISGGAALPVLAVAAAGATGAGAAGYYGYKVEDKTVLKDVAALGGSAIGGTAVGMVTTVAVYEFGSAATAGGSAAGGGEAAKKAKDAFDEAKDKTGKILPSAALKHTPANGHGGNWSGERGNSNWVMNPNTVPANTLSNPEKLSWNEINAKYRHNIESIQFRNGEPDFSSIAVDTVKIKNFTTSRYNNFTQADQTLAEKLGLNASDIAQLRRDNNLTWHERADMGTMDLVPREYHSVPHSGGISNANTMK